MKRISGIIISIVLLLALSCAPAFASEGTVYVTFTNAGNLADSNGVLTALLPVKIEDGACINDVLVTFHNEYFNGGSAVGYEAANSDSGNFITKIWGVETMSVGYYLNGNMAWALSDSVKDGDVIDVWIYKDEVGYSDMYVTISADEKDGVVDFKVLGAGFDENWNVVMNPLEGSDIYLINEKGKIEGSKIATTDAAGKASAEIKAGNYKCITYKDGTVVGACSLSIEKSGNNVLLYCAGGAVILIAAIFILVKTTKKKK